MISLPYKVTYCCSEFEEDDYVDSYLYDIDVSLQDIVEYAFESNYLIEYDPLKWYLEKGSREFVNNIENKYMRNEIDEHELSQDKSFIEFLKNKYKDEVEEITSTNHQWYLRDYHNLDDFLVNH